MSRSTLRIIAVTGVAALSFGAPATAFAASHGHAHTHAAKTHSSNKHHGKPAPRRFTAVGVVTAVDATAHTVTLQDKGGSRDLHGKSVTVVVSDTTKITRNDARVTLDQVQAGDHVAANGKRGADGSLNAAHVNAEGPDATATPEPTDSTSTDTTSTDTTSTDTTSTDTTPTPDPSASTVTTA